MNECEEIMQFLEDAKHQDAFKLQMKAIKAVQEIDDKTHKIAELFFGVGYFAAVHDMRENEQCDLYEEDKGE
jgi:hypothetical protein